MFILSLLLLTVSALDSKIPSSPILSEKIEAKVGRDIIVSSEVDSLASTLSYFNKGENVEQIRRKALDTLVERALMRQYLEKMNVAVSAREVEQRIAAIRMANGAATHDQFLRMLAAQGMTYEQFRDQVKNQLENSQFINLMRRQALFTTDEKELKNYYKNHVKDFSHNYEVELQECLIPAQDNSALAEQLARKYSSNSKLFNECVTKYSQSPSAASNGHIGKFRSGMLRDDIEKKVFVLNKSEVAIIAQPGAVQLLKVVEKRNLGAQAFEEVKEKIRELLEGDVIQKEIQKTLAQLKATTFIQI